MTTAHQLPSPIKGATHIDLTEVVIAPVRSTIIVRGRLGQVSGSGDAATFTADGDLVERTVVLDGDAYEAVFTAGAARGLPVGDFGRADLLSQCDAKGW